MRRYDPVLCDLDGTLIDSAAAITAGLRVACASVGAPLPADADLSPFVGPPLAETFGRLLGHPELVARALDTYRSSYLKMAPTLSSPQPRVHDALRALAGAGVRLAVVTYKLTSVGDAILQAMGLRSFFSEVVGLVNDEDRRNKGDLLRSALARLGGHSRSALYIGDHDLDEQAARDAGVAFARFGEVTWCDLAAAILN